MGLNDSSPGAMRNGRGLSDQWAESVVVRPRTTERHITVHKRLVLGFALSILTLIIVTAVAVVLSLRFDDCDERDRKGATGEMGSRGSGGSGKLNGSRGERMGDRGDEDAVQPWKNSRLPGSVRPRHYDLRLAVYMDNFTFSGEVSIELECINATRFIVLHADRLEVCLHAWAQICDWTLVNISFCLWAYRGICNLSRVEDKFYPSMWPSKTLIAMDVKLCNKLQKHFHKFKHLDQIGEKSWKIWVNQSVEGTQTKPWFK